MIPADNIIFEIFLDSTKGLELQWWLLHKFYKLVSINKSNKPNNARKISIQENRMKN